MVETTRWYEAKPSTIISSLACLCSRNPDTFTVKCDKYSIGSPYGSHTQILYDIIAIVIVATQLHTSEQLAW